MKPPHLLVGLWASGFVFFGAGLPKASAVNFGFDDIPLTVGDVLRVDADGDSIHDLIFTSLGSDPNTGSPLNLGVGYLEFPGTSLLRQPYLFPDGQQAAGPDLKINFIHGVTNSFGLDFSLFGSPSVTEPVLAGEFSLFDAAGLSIGQPVAFNAAPDGWNPFADVSILINLDPSVNPYSIVFDFETGADNAQFWGYGIDNLTGTFGSTEIPGSSPDNPLLPNLPDSNGGFNFSVTFPDPNDIRFIDPYIATGYTYTIAGDLFDAVQPPSNLTDQTFDLLVGDATCTTYTPNGPLTGGLTHTFTTPVPCFRIQGIDIQEALDPANPAAFITGISTVNPGTFTISQTPITQFVPGPLPLTGAGLALAFSRRLRRRIQASRLPATPSASDAAAAG